MRKPTFTSSLRVAAAGLVAAGVCAVLGAGTAVSNADAPADPVPSGYVGLQDASSGAHAEIQVDPSASDAGAITIGLPGTGLVWATAVISGSGTSSVVQIRYDGDASLDAGAQLDDEFGWNNTVSGDLRTVHLRLVGHVDSRSHAGVLNVWVDDRKFQISSADVPTGSALSSLVTRYVAAMRAHDAGAMYDLSDSNMHAATTRKAFVDQAASDPFFAGLTDVATSGSATVSTNESGVRYATITLTARSGGQSQSGLLTLVWDHGAWRVYGVR